MERRRALASVVMNFRVAQGLGIFIPTVYQWLHRRIPFYGDISGRVSLVASLRKLFIYTGGEGRIDRLILIFHNSWDEWLNKGTVALATSSLREDTPVLSEQKAGPSPKPVWRFLRRETSVVTAEYRTTVPRMSDQSDKTETLRSFEPSVTTSLRHEQWNSSEGLQLRLHRCDSHQRPAPAAHIFTGHSILKAGLMRWHVSFPEIKKCR